MFKWRGGASGRGGGGREGSERASLERQLCKELVPRCSDVHLFFDKNLLLLNKQLCLIESL